MKYSSVLLVMAISLLSIPACSRRQASVPRSTAGPKAIHATVHVSANGQQIKVETSPPSLTVKKNRDWVIWNFTGLKLTNARIDYKQAYPNLDPPACESSNGSWICTSSTFPLPCTDCETFKYQYKVTVTAADGRSGQEDPDIIVQR